MGASRGREVTVGAGVRPRETFIDPTHQCVPVGGSDAAWNLIDRPIRSGLDCLRLLRTVSFVSCSESSRPAGCCHTRREAERQSGETVYPRACAWTARHPHFIGGCCAMSRLCEVSWQEVVVPSLIRSGPHATRGAGNGPPSARSSPRWPSLASLRPRPGPRADPMSTGPCLSALIGQGSALLRGTRRRG